MSQLTQFWAFHNRKTTESVALEAHNALCCDACDEAIDHLLSQFDKHISIWGLSG